MKCIVQACLLVLLAACSTDPVAPPRPAPRREATPPPPPAPALPPPLPPAREVRVETEDGVLLVGELRPGASPDAPLVVLVHQLGSARAEWEPLLGHFAAEPALAAFAFDMRGHGQSTSRAGGGTLSHQGFTTADWERTGADVRAIIAQLRAQEGLSPRRVALVGSSIGSSAVILAAAAEPSVSALALLSPGRAYRGVDAITPLGALGARPLLVIASRGEPEGAQTAGDIGRIVPGAEVLLVEGDRHGVSMFESAPEALARVVGFLRAQLGAEAP